MKKSLFKRIFAVSLLALNLGVSTSCHANVVKNASNERITLQLPSTINRELVEMC